MEPCNYYRTFPFMCVWTPGFLSYVICYLFRFWPVALQADLCPDMSPSLFEHVCFMAPQSVLGSSYTCPAPDMEPAVLLGVLVLFSGEWYLEVKIWMRGVLIVSGSQLLCPLGELDHVWSRVPAQAVTAVHSYPSLSTEVHDDTPVPPVPAQQSSFHFVPFIFTPFSNSDSPDSRCPYYTPHG